MNQLTFEELKERLRSLDEVLLLEVLNITSADIVEAFADLIEENQHKLLREINNQ